MRGLWKQVRRGSLVSVDAWPFYRRGLGFHVSSGALLCSEVKHSEATNENSSRSRIPKLLSKNGDSQVVRTFSISEGRCVYLGEAIAGLEI